MNTVKILVHKELATTFNSWSIYIGYTLFFCVCGFFSWLSSNNLLYIGQANMMQVFGIIKFNYHDTGIGPDTTLLYYALFLRRGGSWSSPFRLSGPDRDECMLYLYRHLLLFLVPYCRIGFFHQPRYRFVFPIFIRHVC